MSNQSPTSIEERVRTNEAALAAKRAADLIIEHCLDADKLKPGQELDPIVEFVLWENPRGQSVPDDRKFIATALCNLFPCNPIVSANQLTVFARQGAIESIKALWSHLLLSLERSASAHRKAGSIRGRQVTEYRRGYALAVVERAQQIDAQRSATSATTALVSCELQRTSEAARSRYVLARPTYRQPQLTSATHLGYTDGRRARLTLENEVEGCDS